LCRHTVILETGQRQIHRSCKIGRVGDVSDQQMLHHPMQKHSFNVFKDCPQTISHLLTSMKRVSIASLKRELKARLSAVEQELDDLRSQRIHNSQQNHLQKKWIQG
jgi:hypothetical protein